MSLYFETQHQQEPQSPARRRSQETASDSTAAQRPPKETLAMLLTCRALCNAESGDVWCGRKSLGVLSLDLYMAQALAQLANCEAEGAHLECWVRVICNSLRLGFCADRLANVWLVGILGHYCNLHSQHSPLWTVSRRRDDVAGEIERAEAWRAGNTGVRKGRAAEKCLLEGQVCPAPAW